MLTKPFKPLALAFLVNMIISVEDKIKYKSMEDCFENSVPGILLRGLAVKLLFPLTRFMRAKGLYY